MSAIAVAVSDSNNGRNRAACHGAPQRVFFLRSNFYLFAVIPGDPIHGVVFKAFKRRAKFWITLRQNQVRDIFRSLGGRSIMGGNAVDLGEERGLGLLVGDIRLAGTPPAARAEKTARNTSMRLMAC